MLKDNQRRSLQLNERKMAFKQGFCFFITSLSLRYTPMLRVNKQVGQKQTLHLVQSLSLSYQDVWSENTATNLFTLGCLKEVYVNSKLVDFLQAAKTRHKVSPGCQLYPDELPPMDTMRDPCRDHKCKRGQCQADIGGDGYKCLCKSGYGGQYCDKRNKSKSKSLQIAFP